MDSLTQKINHQLEKLKYLEGTKERNLEILNNRLKEINEEKNKSAADSKTFGTK